MVTITNLEMKDRWQIVNLIDFIYDLNYEQSNRLFNLISNLDYLEGIILTKVNDMTRFTTYEKYKRRNDNLSNYIIIQNKIDNYVIQLKKTK